MTGSILATLAIIWAHLTPPTALVRLLASWRTQAIHTRDCSTPEHRRARASIPRRRPTARARAPPTTSNRSADERGEAPENPYRPTTRQERRPPPTDHHGFAAPARQLHLIMAQPARSVPRDHHRTCPTRVSHAQWAQGSRYHWPWTP